MCICVCMCVHKHSTARKSKKETLPQFLKKHSHLSFISDEYIIPIIRMKKLKFSIVYHLFIFLAPFLKVINLFRQADSSSESIMIQILLFFTYELEIRKKYFKL